MRLIKVEETSFSQGSVRPSVWRDIRMFGMCSYWVKENAVNVETCEGHNLDDIVLFLGVELRANQCLRTESLWSLVSFASESLRFCLQEGFCVAWKYTYCHRKVCRAENPERMPRTK